MKKVFKWLITASLVLMMTSCFGSSWNVKVGKDGAGTLTLRMYMSKSFSEMMAGMGGGDAEMSGEDFMAKNDPAEMAAKIGEGVTVVSAQAFETDTEVGFETVYKFDNINNLKLNPMAADPNAEGSGDPGDKIQFFMENGKLRILMLGNAGGEMTEMGDEDPEAAQAQAMMGMMKDLFADMKFKVTVEATDKITKTNASYRDGNIITLMDLEMSKIMDDEFLFNEMVESKNASSKEVQKQLEDAGVLMENQVEVTVEF